MDENTNDWLVLFDVNQTIDEMPPAELRALWNSLIDDGFQILVTTSVENVEKAISIVHKVGMLRRREPGVYTVAKNNTAKLGAFITPLGLLTCSILIDDAPENIKAARMIGMKTILFEAPNIYKLNAGLPAEQVLVGDLSLLGKIIGSLRRGNSVMPQHAAKEKPSARTI